jgi:hypothetical protein
MERLQFDELFKKYFEDDINLEILNTFDIIRDKGVLLSSLALDIIYSQLFSSESYQNDTLNEEVCALAACLIQLL